MEKLMSEIILVVWLVLLCFPAVGIGATGESVSVRLSVSDCVTKVLHGNPDIDAATERIEQARNRLAKARSATGIFLDTDLGFITGDTPSAYLFKMIDARSLEPGTDFNNPGRFSALELGFTARYSLLDGGRKKHSIGQAEKMMYSQEQQREVVVNNLVGAVVQTYFSILAAEEYAIVARKSLSTIESQLREVEVRAEAGGALKSDVLSIEVRLAKGKERVISAENSVALAKSAMRQLLDLPPAEEIKLSGEEWTPAPIPETLEGCIKEAMKNRPEIKSIDEMLNAARESVALARSNDNPSLDLVGRYAMTDDGGSLSMARDNWTLGAQVRWNIFDNGLVKNEIGESKSALKELEAKRRSIVRLVEVQTHKAFLSLAEARTRGHVAEVNTKRSEESLALVKEQYESGLVTVTRYLQSEDDRTEALFRFIKSKFDIKKAKAALGNAIGYCARFAK